MENICYHFPNKTPNYSSRNKHKGISIVHSLTDEQSRTHKVHSLGNGKLLSSSNDKKQNQGKTHSTQKSYERKKSSHRKFLNVYSKYLN